MNVTSYVPGCSADIVNRPTVGDGGLHLTAGHRAARLDGDAGQNEARCIGHQAFDGCVLGAGDAGRDYGGGEHQHDEYLSRR